MIEVKLCSYCGGAVGDPVPGKLVACDCDKEYEKEQRDVAVNRCGTCDAPMLGSHYHETDETDEDMAWATLRQYLASIRDYTEDPKEVTPCLACGEPKPNEVPCLNSDCSAFGGVRRFVTLTFQVAAGSDEWMSNADSIREWIEQALDEEGLFDPPPSYEGSALPGGPWLEQVSVEPTNAA